MSRCFRRVICSEFDDLSCFYHVYQSSPSFKSGCSWVYLCLHSTCLFIGILVLQLSNVTGIARYLKRKCTASKGCVIPIRDGEVEIDSDTDSLPDRLKTQGSMNHCCKLLLNPQEATVMKRMWEGKFLRTLTVPLTSWVVIITVCTLYLMCVYDTWKSNVLFYSF